MNTRSGEQVFDDDESKEFKEGRAAFSANKRLSENPYVNNTEKYEDWDSGWHIELNESFAPIE